MSIKICSKCGESKLLYDFYKMKQSKDGYRPDCKVCNKESKRKYEMSHPIEHRLVVMASAILKRIKYAQVDKNHHLKCYKDNKVKCLLGETREQVTETLREHFYDDIKYFIDRGLIPSVDRIDPSGNYELGNIRIIDYYENGKLGFINANKRRMKPVRAIFSDGSYADFESLKDAERNLGIYHSCIKGLIESGGVSRKDKVKFKYIS